MGDMTPTERLCELLDERGVEYVLDEEYGKKYPPEQRITWSSDIAGEDMTVTARDYCMGINDDGSNEYYLDLEFHEVFTPEQAIAATLGREPDHAAMTRLHDQLNATMLKYEMAQGIEKRDGDEAIVVPWVAKMHALLEEAATLGAGTCKARLYKPEYGLSDCTICECGEINDISANYCNKCGRLIEVLSE